MGAACAAGSVMLPDYLSAPPGPPHPHAPARTATAQSSQLPVPWVRHGFIEKSVSSCSPHWPPAGNLGFLPVFGRPQALMHLCQPMLQRRAHAPTHPSLRVAQLGVSPHPHLPFQHRLQESGWRATPTLLPPTVLGPSTWGALSCPSSSTTSTSLPSIAPPPPGDKTPPRQRKAARVPEPTAFLDRDSQVLVGGAAGPPVQEECGDRGRGD